MWASWCAVGLNGSSLSTFLQLLPTTQWFSQKFEVKLQSWAISNLGLGPQMLFVQQGWSIKSLSRNFQVKEQATIFWRRDCSSCPRLQLEEVTKSPSSRVFHLGPFSCSPSVTALDNTYEYMTESSRRDVALWIARNLQILKGNTGKPHIPADSANRFFQESKGSACRLLPGGIKPQQYRLVHKGKH